MAAKSDEEFANRLAFLITENADDPYLQKAVKAAIMDGIERGKVSQLDT